MILRRIFSHFFIALKGENKKKGVKSLLLKKP